MRVATKAPAAPPRHKLTLVPSSSPVLSRISSRLSPKGIRASQLLVKEMRQVMHESDGIGLSAPQVGIAQALSVVEVLPDPQLPNLQAVPFIALFNPNITASSGKQDVWEGCLSLPGKMGLVSRADDVTVSYLDEHAMPRKLRATGYLAALFQHELDHLQGKLYTQRLLDAKYLISLEVWQQYHQPELAAVRGNWQYI